MAVSFEERGRGEDEVVVPLICGCSVIHMYQVQVHTSIM